MKGCFGCGSENPAGLGLVPRVEADGSVRAEVVGKPVHRGYTKLLHGGVVCAALDEVLSYAVSQRTGPRLFVTTSLDVRFRRPAPLGEKLALVARCTAKRGSRFVARARLEDARGRLLAEGVGRFVILPERLRARFVAR